LSRVARGSCDFHFFVSSAMAGEDRKRKILWLWFCVCLAPFSFFSLYIWFPDIIHKRQSARPSFLYPRFSDLQITLYALVIFVPLRILLAKRVFKSLGDYVIPTLQERKSWTQQDREARVDRFGTVMFKFIFFVFVTTYGYMLMKDCDFFPPQLGGHGTVSNAFMDFPFTPINPGLQTYYLIELGYHVQSLLFHIFGEHRNDYLEMMLHHTCAVLLVLFSYFSNFLRIGSLVLFVHDIADVFGYALKAMVDTKHVKITLTLYACLLVVWAYARFYCFPALIISGIYDAIKSVNQEWYIALEWSYFLGMLYILLFLHIYWYALFLLAGYSYTRTGVTQDLQHKVGGEVKATKGRHSKSKGTSSKLAAAVAGNGQAAHAKSA